MKIFNVNPGILFAALLAGVIMAGSVQAQDVQKGGYIFSATDLIDVNVVNLENDTIDEIDDFIVSDRNGLVYAVLSVGGFLNIGDKLVTVPYDELQLSKDEDGDTHVQFNATEKQLKERNTFVYKDGEMTWKSRQEERREELLAELKEQQKDLQKEQQDLAAERKDVEKVKQELQKTETKTN
jgi:hypothetical protein